MTVLKNIILKKDKEKSLRRKHPWIFSGAVEKIQGSIHRGDIVDVFSHDNMWLAKGVYSPASQIRVRTLSFNEDEKIDYDFIAGKITSANNLRKKLINRNTTNAYRAFASESDGIPGLIIDVYDNIAVCQFLAASAEKFRNEILDSIESILMPVSIYERSDVDVRKKEGLVLQSGLLFGREVPPLVEITENNLKFLVNIISGHKTGFYLDQRENRKYVGEFAAGKSVLNCFSYTGGFGIAALTGGAAKVINVDSSDSVLSLAKQNFELNGFNSTKFDLINEDVFKLLREYRNSNQRFDLIILDPPKFIESKSHLEKAARGYKDINMLAFQLLQKDGLLFTFSCSGLMTPELFQKIVADAALDAGRHVRIIKFLHQAPDHPISTNFPEANYLKGLAVAVG